MPLKAFSEVALSGERGETVVFLCVGHGGGLSNITLESALEGL